MFNTHCKAVQEYSQRSAPNMTDTVLMVVLSIQQNWLGVGDQLADVRLRSLGLDSCGATKEKHIAI